MYSVILFDMNLIDFFNIKINLFEFLTTKATKAWLNTFV